jgi:acyl-CoA synthetase (AMP-forming)/AMP-acid ligase II
MKELIYHRQLLPAAARMADHRCVIDGAYEATLGTHVERSLRLANALRDELGVAKGDRFAVMALNSHRYLEMYHAGFLGGAVVNPLNLRLAPKELAFILGDSGTRVVFTDATFAPLIDAVREDAEIDTVVLVGDGDVAHDLSYEEILSAASADVPPEPDEDDPAILMYTGGTTGLPKGVLLEQRALVLDQYKLAMVWGTGESTVYLHQTPMFHAASLGAVLALPCSGGATTFVPSFEPGAVLDVIERNGVTMTVMVPTMIGMMLAHPAFTPERLATLSQLTYGASPMPGPLLDKLLEMFPTMDIYQGYGMTENAGLLTALLPDDHRRGGPILRSAGRPVPGSVVSIQDEDGKILGPDETGEVCARAGNFMREYWKRPAETAEAFRNDWYRTGDAGRIDADGYVYLVDRVKDMIVTGGENVYSAEVEDAVASHPAVLQVAVIGIPHEMWGELVHAVIVLRPGMTATEEEIKEHTRRHIAGYKVPKSVEFRTDPLPMSGAMKVLKRELRAPYWADKDRAVG